MRDKRGLRTILNRKGESEAQGFTVGGVIAVVFMVVVILAIAYWFFYGRSAATNIPDDISAAVLACKGFSSQTTYFCDQPHDATIGGSKQKVNCDYPSIKSKLELSVDITCPKDYRTWGLDQCKSYFANNNVVASTEFNDVVCSSLTCSQLGGQELTKDACSKVQGGIPIVSNFGDSKTFAAKNPVTVCCANAPDNTLVGKECTSSGATGTIQNIDSTTGSCPTGKNPLVPEGNSPNKPGNGQLCCSN